MLACVQKMKTNGVCNMKNILVTASVLAVSASGALAGGIDRSGQGNSIIFENGNYVELSFGSVIPSVSGNDLAIFGGGASGDVAASYVQLSLGVKVDLNENMSLSLIVDQPFGADVEYAATSVALGGTIAEASSTAVTAIARYKFTDRVSVFGGLRAQSSSAAVTLSGAAYGLLSSYSVDLASNTSFGYLVGAAYEIPDIALRVALTYNSAITHDFDTVEMLGAAVIGTASTEVMTPQSINLDFQTGVAEGTLVFGSIRWADWSEFSLDPATFVGLAGGGLISLDDSTTYTIGVGRKFNDMWSGAFSLSYEAEGSPLVSPLAPTNGKFGATLAAIYTNGDMKISTGINYTKLGDSTPETSTPDTARAIFADNSAIGIGVKVGYSF